MRPTLTLPPAIRDTKTRREDMLQAQKLIKPEITHARGGGKETQQATTNPGLAANTVNTGCCTI